MHNLSSLYEKHLPGIQVSENGTPLPGDGTPLPDPETNEIVPYLTKGLLYDALAGLATGGDNIVAALGVLDTESMANQTSIHKIIGTPKPHQGKHSLCYISFSIPSCYGRRLEQAIVAMLS